MFPGIWDADPVMGFAGVLAHQGGWDEALMVVVPLAIFVGLMWVAYRKPPPDGGTHPRDGGTGPT